jgi:hypothetical protein
MMKTTLKSLITRVVLALTLSLNVAWAISLDQAKSQGLVGETPSGYLASVNPSPKSEVTQLISDINQKRKAAYKESASKAGVELKVIEARIGQKLYERADKGEYLQSTSGQWYKKK